MFIIYILKVVCTVDRKARAATLTSIQKRDPLHSHLSCDVRSQSQLEVVAKENRSRLAGGAHKSPTLGTRPVEVAHVVLLLSLKWLTWHYWPAVYSVPILNCSGEFRGFSLFDLPLHLHIVFVFSNPHLYSAGCLSRQRRARLYSKNLGSNVGD